MADERIIYGARCSWWGTIDEIWATTSGLPVCPHCGSPLFEVESETEWWEGVARYEAIGSAGRGDPGYREFVEWLRGKCYPSLTEARAIYDAQRGA